MSEPVDPAQAAATPTAHRGDLTQGPILRTLLVFSLPMLVTNALQSLNSSVNAVLVGRLLGEAALAATAIANLILFLIYAVIFGLGTAATIRVGHFYGAREMDEARKVLAAAIGFTALLGLGSGLAGFFAADAILAAMATPAESRADALVYLQVSFLSVPIIAVSMMLSMGLRGAGDARTPLNAMILTLVLNAALNPVLILGLGPIPPLGTGGSALASAVATLAGAAIMVRAVQARGAPLRLGRGQWRYLWPQGPAVGYIAAKGLPTAVQMLAISGAGLIMIGLVNRQGLHVSAAYGASLQLWNYLQMPSFAIGAAVSAMVAQSIGAGGHARVGPITRAGMWMSLALAGTLAVVLVVFGRPLLALFLGGSSPALAPGEHILLLCTWSFVAGNVMLILNSTMRAYGEVMLQLIIMIVSMYPARIGSYYLLRPWIGEEAVWWAYPAGSVIGVVLSWLAYARGGWRTRHTGEAAV